MELRSLAHRTDLIFGRFHGTVETFPDHLVVRTPSRPFYFWGNYLIYDRAPAAGDCARWCARHREIFSPDAEPSFMTFTWDAPGPDGAGADGTASPDDVDVSEFLTRGFRLDTNDVLTATRVVPPAHPNEDVIVREVRTDAEWEALVDVHLGTGWYLDPASEEPFTRNDLLAARRMAEAGLGRRFAAFLHDRPVADLGIYTDGEWGRFHSVVTHRDHRRRGLCGTLLHEASRIAFAEMGVQTLVIVAQRDSDAGRVYRRGGFRQTETQHQLEWFDAERHGAAS